MMHIFIWLCGGAGILLNGLIYQQKSRMTLLRCKWLANCFWAVHYALLGAWSGAAVCAIGILRETVFLCSGKKAAPKGWLVFFLLLAIGSAIYTWKDFSSILPALASAVSVFSFWKGDPRLTKYLSFPISGCFLTYNIACHSWLGIVNEGIVLLSTIIGVWRMHRKNS